MPVKETNICSKAAGLNSADKALPETTPVLQDEGRNQSTSIHVTDAGVEIIEKPEHEIDVEEDVLNVFSPHVEPKAVQGPTIH